VIAADRLTSLEAKNLQQALLLRGRLELTAGDREVARTHLTESLQRFREGPHADPASAQETRVLLKQAL